MTDEQENILDAKIEQLNNDFSYNCQVVKDKIKESQAEINQLKAAKKITKEEEDVRSVHIYKYYTELSNAIKAYRNLNSDFKNKEKEMLKQQYQIVNPKATEADLKKIFDDDSAELESAFSLGGASSKKMLQSAKTRSNKINKIVEKVNKLVELIEEVDNIVKSNTNVINETVINMDAAEQNTKQTNAELEAALVYQRRINFFKKLVLGVVGFFMLLLVLYFGSGIFKGGSSGTTTNNYYNSNQ